MSLDVENPMVVMIVACAGLASNIVAGAFLGVHDHSHAGEPGNLDVDPLVRDDSVHDQGSNKTENAPQDSAPRPRPPAPHQLSASQVVEEIHHRRSAKFNSRT